MRLEEASVNGSGQAVREALARKSDWEQHGPSQWGYGVAIDLLALERRVAALEKGDCPARMEFPTPPGEGWRWVEPHEPLERGDQCWINDVRGWLPVTCYGDEWPIARQLSYRRRINSHANHDAAPAARAPTDASPLRSGSGVTVGMGTGGTQEPVAFAVMSGGRSYDIYDTCGEAEAICRWLCEEESSDIWRVVPLVPCDATPPLHATSQECSVPPECTEQPAITEAEWDALYRGTAVLLWEGHTREAGSEGSRNLLQIAATLKSLRERLEGGTK